MTPGADAFATPHAPSPVYPLRQSYTGRFMLPDKSEYPCRLTAIDRDGALLLTPHVPPPGVAILAYIEEVGRIEGVTAEAEPGGRRLRITLTGVRRERFERHLDWLARRNLAEAPPDRRHTRFEPRERRARITLPDGGEYPCEVADISLSGAGIRAAVRPPLGTWVMLGKTRARVVRLLEEGFAIEFLTILERSDLESRL